jgi:hypothetical protein
MADVDDAKVMKRPVVRLALFLVTRLTCRADDTNLHSGEQNHA